MNPTIYRLELGQALKLGVFCMFQIMASSIQMRSQKRRMWISKTSTTTQKVVFIGRAPPMLPTADC
jgi:hypothetical protein